MRLGLLFIWASAIAAMFFLYIIFNAFVWFIGPLDSAGQEVVSSGTMSSSWVDFYYSWTNKYKELFGYFIAGNFVALIIYVIVNSARREEDAYTVPY